MLKPKPTCSPRPSPKREAILDAAQAVFLDMGYAAASMDGIAARAGVSKATIYAHFEGKDDLFGAIIRRRCEANLGYASLPEFSEGDARTALTALAKHLTTLLAIPETLGMYRVVVAEASRQPELARAFYEAGPTHGRTKIAQVFEDLDRKGELKVPDSWAAADMFVGLLRGDAFQRLLLGLPEDPRRTAEATIRTTVDAMLKVFGR
jgi:TetR/AcrR family transcriptional repressor of mexJK operon